MCKCYAVLRILAYRWQLVLYSIIQHDSYSHFVLAARPQTSYFYNTENYNRQLFLAFHLLDQLMMIYL